MTHYRDADEPQPWERMPDETASAFSAFQIYRDLAPAARYCRAVADRYYQGRNPAGTGARPSQVKQVQTWSAAYNWRDRAAAWDAWRVDQKEEQERQAEVEAYKDMLRRHLDLGRALQSKVAMRLRGGIFNDADGRPFEVKGLHPDALGPGSLVDWLRVGIEVERQARGVVDSVMANFDQAGTLARKMDDATVLIDKDLRAEMLAQAEALGFTLADLDGPGEGAPVDDDPEL